MEKKHKEYLIIPFANIKNKDELLNITDDNLTENHRKLILKLSMADNNHPGDAYEITTNEPFYFKNSLFDILYKGTPLDNLIIESDNLSISIHPNFVTIDEVKIFLGDIILSKEAKLYKEEISKLLLKDQKKLIKKEH